MVLQYQREAPYQMNLDNAKLSRNVEGTVGDTVRGLEWRCGVAVEAMAIKLINAIHNHSVQLPRPNEET